MFSASRAPRIVLFLLSLTLLLSSCRAYRQTLLFQTDGSVDAAQVKGEIAKAEQHYVIKVQDVLDVQVFTNKGELLIDPTRILNKEAGTAGAHSLVPMYIVQPGGFVRLPMVDQLKVEGLTLSQADSVLQKAYSAYYHDAFVVTKVQNHRVIVLGALGNKIVPLANQEVNLLEVLALAGPPLGNFTGKAENIRIIRGDLQKPNVIVVNLSTIEGLTRHNLRIFPNDVVYVEPIRQDYREAIRDIAPIATIFGNLAAILAILFRAGVL